MLQSRWLFPRCRHVGSPPPISRGTRGGCGIIQRKRVNWRVFTLSLHLRARRNSRLFTVLFVSFGTHANAGTSTFSKRVLAGDSLVWTCPSSCLEARSSVVMLHTRNDDKRDVGWASASDIRSHFVICNLCPYVSPTGPPYLSSRFDLFATRGIYCCFDAAHRSDREKTTPGSSLDADER